MRVFDLKTGFITLFTKKDLKVCRDMKSKTETISKFNDIKKAKQTSDDPTHTLLIKYHT